MLRKTNQAATANESLETEQGGYVRDLIEGLKLCDVCEDDAWLDFTGELESRDVLERIADSFGFGALTASIRRIH